MVRNPKSKGVRRRKVTGKGVFSIVIGDSLKRDDKLEIIRSAAGVSNMKNMGMWSEVSIDAHGDWFSHRDDIPFPA